MRKLFVTGGAGFIGSNFVRYVLGKYPDAEVVVFDKLTYAGNLENLRDLEESPRYQFVRGDIGDPLAVADAMQECDAVVNFAAESVAADTFIPIHFGHGIKIVTAEELFAAYAEKRGVAVNVRGVEVVEPDLPLFALSYHNGMGQWRRITHITRHHYQGKVVTLRQKWGSVTVTPNHSVYNAAAELVAAETNPELLAIRKINVDRSRHRSHLKICLPNIKSKDDLLYADGGHGPKSVYLCQTLSGEPLAALMRFLGAYVAEGSATFNHANGAWQVCISNKDIEFLEQVQQDASLFTNGSSSITRREAPNVSQLVFSSHVLYLLVETLCGVGSQNKQVPDALYTLADEYKQAFLNSYLRGDGSTEQYKTVEIRRLSTNSPKLAAGLGLLLSLMDLDYSLSYRDFEDKENWHPAYSIAIVSSYDSRLRCQSTEHEYEGWVYDLTVEGSHNFAAGIGNTVVHNTHVDRSLLEPDSFIQTNVHGTLVLLEAALRFGVERYLQVSTDEVYGSLLEDSARETDRLNPRGAYSASKAGGDMMVNAYFHTHGVPAIITRGSNNFGPYQYPEKMIPLFITNALQDKPLPVYGDGLYVRDWLYVLDHCEGIDLALRQGTPGEIYNVGGGNELTNLEVIRRLLQLLGKPETLIQYVKDRPGHDRRYSIDCRKLHALGWRPTRDFDEALAETVAWYRENEAWWRKIQTGEYRDYYRKMYEGREIGAKG